MLFPLTTINFILNSFINNNNTTTTLCHWRAFVQSVGLTEFVTARNKHILDPGLNKIWKIITTFFVRLASNFGTTLCRRSTVACCSDYTQFIWLLCESARRWRVIFGLVEQWLTRGFAKVRVPYRDSFTPSSQLGFHKAPPTIQSGTFNR